MHVRWPTIRWAVCWCLAFSLLPAGGAWSAAERKPQVVTGKISLPEDVTRAQEAANPPVEGSPAAAVDPGQARPGEGPQVVTGKIGLPEDVAPAREPAKPSAADDLDAPADTGQAPPGEPSGPLPNEVRMKIALPQPETAPAPAAPQPSPEVLSPLSAEKDKLKPIYSYNPEGKIDPFEPLFRAKPKEVEKKEKKTRPKRVPRTPLEMVDISQLKLSAIITAPSGNRALVEEASGKGYVIRVGTPVGIHWGKVAEIKIDSVIVEEEVENLMGDYVKRNREMKLNKPTGE